MALVLAQREVGQAISYSTLREEIRFMIVRDGSAKTIVFSQFTSFLGLIHYYLEKSGISCVQLD
uniref:Uncharacterized protein n=1 Tax=Solanum lycopersicum TaxID=4081 RepID=K4CE19_SOLLC